MHEQLCIVVRNDIRVPDERAECGGHTTAYAFSLDTNPNRSRSHPAGTDGASFTWRAREAATLRSEHGGLTQ